MNKCVIIDNGVVVDVRILSDDEIITESRSHHAVIVVDNMSPQPDVGWVIENSVLVPVSSNATQDEKDLVQQTAQRVFGLSLLARAVDNIGARNLKLARENTPTNVATLASQMASIKILLESGALKTVRSIINSIKESHTTHLDILEDVVVEITNFLVTNGYE